MADLKEKICPSNKAGCRYGYGDNVCNNCNKILDEYIAEHDAKVRANAIYEYMNKLCDKCIQMPNECWNLECPFADDVCLIVKIAEQLKEGNK